MGFIMTSGKRNLLIAVGVMVVIGAIYLNSYSRYSAFVERFDIDKARQRGLPMLVEYGFQACPPCKMLKPVLESLDREYSDDFAIGYVDIMADRNAVSENNIRATPTLIFYDKDGNELGRIEGYVPKEVILNKWKELGVDITGAK